MKVYYRRQDNFNTIHAAFEKKTKYLCQYLKNIIYSSQRLVILIEFHFFAENETAKNIQLATCSLTQTQKVAMSRPEIVLFFPPICNGR